MDARDHAVAASSLLNGAEALTRRLTELTPDEHLQMVVSGGIARSNADLQWTVALAQAHALTALALRQTEPVPEPVHEWS